MGKHSSNCVRKVNGIKNKGIFGGNPDSFSIYNTKMKKCFTPDDFIHNCCDFINGVEIFKKKY